MHYPNGGNGNRVGDEAMEIIVSIHLLVKSGVFFRKWIEAHPCQEKIFFYLI